jgi:hypothetical protein
MINFATIMINILFKAFLIGIAVSSLNACSPKKEETQPEFNVITRDSMMMVMVDLHLTEAGIVSNLYSGSGLLNNRDTLQAMVMKKYGLKDEYFVRSYKYYESQPELFHELYEKITDRLGELQSSLQAESASKAD